MIDGGGVAATLTNGVDYTLKLDMIGSTVSVFLNGEQMISVVDSSISAKGLSGIRQYNNTTVSDATGEHIASFLVEEADSEETITLSPDPASVMIGGTRQITITRSDPAPAGGIAYNLTSSAPAIASVPVTVDMLAGQAAAAFNVTGLSLGSCTITATNAADSEESDSLAVTVSAATVTTLRVRVHADAVGAPGVKGIVFDEPAGNYLAGAKIGEFVNQQAKSLPVGGEAEIDVPVSAFGGGALVAGDHPIVYVQAGTFGCPQLVVADVVEV